MFPLHLWLTGRQLAAESPQTRLGAIQKLRQRSSASVLLVLAKVLEDPDESVRAEARGALQEGLRAAPEAVQMEVLKALKQDGCAPAQEAMVVVLQAGTTSVRWQAAQALRAKGWQPRNDVEEVAFHIAVGDLERAAQVGTAATGPLSYVLCSGQYQHRVTAANMLGQLADPEALPALTAALKDQEAIVRAAAASALGRLKQLEAVEALMQSLGDGDAHVRSAVAGALGAINDPQSVNPLIALLKDKDWEVRVAALESLGRVLDPRALGPVVACLADADAEVRQHAAESLGKMGDESCLGKLLLLALDEHAGVRQAALRAANRISHDWQHADEARKLVPDFHAALQHKHVGVQQTATDLLKRITGLTPLQFAEANNRAAAEQRLAAAARVLAGLLNHRNPVVRLASAQALERMALPACVDALREAVDDPDAFVQAATRSALNTLTRRAKEKATG